MSPFYFGPPERRLFGIFERAKGAAPAVTAALLCNPFGQEAIRAHRMYRVLANRLTSTGVDVLRFDYFGTGDSAGDDVDGEIDGWTCDINAAHAELTRRSRSSRVVWVGARLGAALAAQASVSVPRMPDKLILWEPVIDGAAYLRELRERHVLVLADNFEEWELPWRAMVASGSMPLQREALGFELGDELRAQLCALSNANFTLPRALRCDMITRPDELSVAGLVARCEAAGLTINQVALEYEFDWMAHEAMNTALVPTEPVQLLAELVTEPK
jgi:pimeloyl-ACP methyl ester carboxylesterase